MDQLDLSAILGKALQSPPAELAQAASPSLMPQMSPPSSADWTQIHFNDVTDMSAQMRAAGIEVASRFHLKESKNRCKYCDAQDQQLREKYLINLSLGKNAPMPTYRNKTWSFNMSSNGKRQHLFRYHLREIKVLIANQLQKQGKPIGHGSMKRQWRDFSDTPNTDFNLNTSTQSGASLDQSLTQALLGLYAEAQKKEADTRRNSSDTVSETYEGFKLEDFLPTMINPDENTEQEAKRIKLETPLGNVEIKSEEPEQQQLQPATVTILEFEHRRLLEIEQKYNKLKSKFNDIGEIFNE